MSIRTIILLQMTWEFTGHKLSRLTTILSNENVIDMVNNKDLRALENMSWFFLADSSCKYKCILKNARNQEESNPGCSIAGPMT